MKDAEFKSGFVAVIGRPNVGKSTFVNEMVGKKVAIISPKPQTTRNRILGVRTTEEYQLAFTDTPGIHKPETELGRRMVQTSYHVAKEVDVVLFMTTPLKKVLKGDEIILENLKKTNIPVFLVINKIDQLPKKSSVDLTIALYQNLYPFEGVFPISVLERKNLDHLLDALLEKIPYGPKYYPEEMISDHSVSFLIQEVIREKILFLFQEEIPHSIAVVVEQILPCLEFPNYQDVYATIYVERESQRKILIGKNGDKIKEIKEKSKSDIRKILGSKVHLELWIKVKKDWKDRPNDLQNLGYSKEY